MSIVPDPSATAHRRAAPAHPAPRTRRRASVRRHPPHPRRAPRRRSLPSTPRDRSPVPADGRREGVGPALVVGHAAARAQGRQDPAARGRRRADHAGGNDCAPRSDHAGDRTRRVRAPQRHRLRLRDQGPRPVPRQRLPRSQGPRRRVPRHPGQDPHRRGARPVAGTFSSCAGSTRVWSSSRVRPVPASRRRSAR